MGLLDFLRKLKNSEKEARILVLGLDNAGKTTCLKKLSEEDITNVTPTQGFNVKTLSTKEFKLNVWDIGGQKAIRTYWKEYYPKTDGIMWVIDSSDKKRLKETGNELALLLDEQDLSGVPLLILANKQDIINCLLPKEIAEALSLHLIKDRKWQIQPCSAKTSSDKGLKEGMEWIMKQLSKNLK